MNFRRLILCGAVGALAVLLTGCVWLRLLSLKNQLAEFDRYFKVDDRHGLAIQCLKPVLYAQDVRYLMELDPTRVTTNQTRQTWHWTFQKVRDANSPEAGDFDLTFTTSFENKKLVEFALSERFLVVLPRQFILGMLRSIGHAEVDQKKRAVTVKLEDDAMPDNLKPPTMDDVSRLLGRPFATRHSATNSILDYRYQLISPSLKTNDTMLAKAIFTFAKSGSGLRQMDFVYGNSRIYLSFDEPKAKPAAKPGT